ncbi:calcium-transporting ATPase [[Clostridium] sordellii]|nr:calcium-transporting ATPase [[Clostridium] sordellii] [Paeniclostridium sordellii]CEP88117.1 calcium-transporting ATPase [[Clostridium] sordellii] [Paeniclostridium sordellii]CEP97181.1 calcium-transporting ATPase [[Clostridium] sordellii] [Paeniclostridium sordellii]CEQ00870.1 calcium-transporting ATPase [[Clostridium] sordellii] [Paeniclostridium sordellii]
MKKLSGRFYNKDVNMVTKDLDSNLSTGLSNEEVEKRRLKFGLNEFTPHEGSSFFEDLKDSLTEPMIIILLIAAVVSALVGEIHDALGIIGAIALGVAIGMITEGKSKKAADALSKMTENIEVKVLRNGHITTISKNELVPGDVVMLETGDMIPADGRLVESINLKVREDMLTGESDDVSKKADVIIPVEEIEAKGEKVEQDPIPAKQINMVFGGTLVAYGRGTMIVTSIGDNTQMGEIAQNLNVEQEETPLQIKLGDLGSKIAKVSSAIAGLLFIYMVGHMVIAKTLHINTSSPVAFLESIDPIKTAFTVCIALIVAAVPEGLPTMINMTLAITMQKMAKINALVTKKEACETIGSVSVICSDKTGTLTQNRMTVEEVAIEGMYFLENCLINSTADIEIDKESNIKYMGSATECALLLKHKDKDYNKARQNANIIDQEQFSSATKQMSTTISLDGKEVKLIKGAPEIILQECSHMAINDEQVKAIEDSHIEEILFNISKLQEKSMRVLGFSHEVDGMKIFNGFVGIKDPLRLDVKDAVMTAKKAGVLTKMLTGDNINTAKAIGEELGLLDNNMRAVESSYIDTLTDEELRKEIQTISIVARSKPDTKMRVVSALQALDEVVAVTGDGINDAPALSKADVGIAMGIAGTEVSKNAADIILTDDSFSTIVKGIQWGRGIFENFQRFVQFQLTVNMVAFLIAIICTVTGQDMPFTTIQLLWVNIIMDGPPALALGLEPVRKHVLDRPPIHKNAGIITKSMMYSMIGNALLMTGLIYLQIVTNFLNVNNNEQGTVTFALFAFLALFNALNCREFNTESIIPNFFKNKVALEIIGITGVAQIVLTQVFTDFFSSVPLDLMIWIKIILASFSIIVINEVVKIAIKLFTPKEKVEEDELSFNN